MKTQSSELQRKAEESHNNILRLMEWQKKSAIHRYLSVYADKHELDVTDPQEPDNYDKTLSEDPAYQEFIDNVNKTPF